MALWKRSKDDDETRPENDEQPRASSSQGRPSEEADERTRLIPRHNRGPGYLDPDDPAVCSNELAANVTNHLLGEPVQSVERSGITVV
jgi:hypothetical protein